MNVSSLSAAYIFGELAGPRLMAEEAAAMIVLAASLLVFRTFRERYLLVWIVGWLAYFVSRWTLSADGSSTRYTVAISQGEFVLAICLFVSAVFVYSHRAALLRPLLVVSSLLIGLAIARPLLWANVPVLRIALEVGYRLMALIAAFYVIRFRWARWEIGSWMLGVSLLLLRLDWAPVSAYFPTRYIMMTDVLLGVSMLLIVFDDSRMHVRRLNVIHALTTSTIRAEQHGPMMFTALEQLQTLMLAKAAWFRLVEDDRMVISQQIGLSEDFLRDRHSVALDDKFESTFQSEEAIVIKTESADDSVRPYLRREGFHHCVLVPVRGKKSNIGVLTLGSAHRFAYAPDDVDFLITSAHQLGLAVENLRLVEQILRSHRQWSNTFDSIQDMVLLHDSEFRVMKANHSLLARLEQSPADVMGKTCESVLPQEQSAWAGCPYCIANSPAFHEGRDPAFGGYAMVSTSSYVEQGSKQRGTIHVVRDISQRHEAEEKYRQLFDQVQEGVFVATSDGKLTECNEAFVQMLGYGSKEELKALNVNADLYASPEQRELFRKQVQAKNYVRNFEVMLRRKDGSLLTAMESSFATRDAEGKIDRYQGFLLDITEKKRAEDEIRRRNRELNALNAMAVIATQSFDLDEILNLTLRQVISLLGGEAGAIFLSDAGRTTFRRRAAWGQGGASRGRKADVVFPEGFGKLVTQSRAEVITAEYLPHLPTAVLDFVRVEDGNSWIWVLLWGKDEPIGIMGLSSAERRDYNSNDENLLVAISRQLATTIEKVRLYEESCRAYEDLRHTQEQLLQSEKMSAVGQLISGVAHELNNPLTAILGYAQLLESEGLSEKAADFAAKLFKQAQRTHRVVQNLLSFARQRKPHKQDVDVCKVLEETLALRDYDLKVNNIKLEREIEESIPSVKGDPHQLEQVFLNIINNSVDAMLEAGHGGKLRVKINVKDGRVNISFHDSGPGFAEPSRIFDPFYTTKSVGKGTGLGLSICYGIVKEHEGDIRAHNLPEGGANIEISLPTSGFMISPTDLKLPERREKALSGNILLIEDEEAVLEFERDLLTGAGASVTTLANCDALNADIVTSEVNALIVNGLMPGGWNAARVHDWLATNRPGMEKRVLFTYSVLLDSETRKYLQQNNLPYLVKPFEVAELIDRARRLMQRAQAATAS
jgi:PAS domain S-box-containing protein